MTEDMWVIVGRRVHLLVYSSFLTMTPSRISSSGSSGPQLFESIILAVLLVPMVGVGGSVFSSLNSCYGHIY